MKSVFLVSDTHFSHAGVCRFLRDDNTKLRPWDDPDEMDEYMIQAWNDTVKPKDKVYHLGDVVVNRRGLQIMPRLNGEKILIKGNHDNFPLRDYVDHFKDILAYHSLHGLLLSHIPVHPESLYRYGCNVHGHLHERRVMKDLPDGRRVIDPRYYSVCVEHTEYKPILLEEVRKNIREQQDEQLNA
ncbi:hypothetical protein [Orrella sp. 11846]|uniref:hypothetical protein n=1 Tax=Orrella sp. 11846 TaxID=3409913 RepID=UPI003B5B3271